MKNSIVFSALFLSLSAHATPVWEEGDYDATVVTFEVPASTVRKLLPEGVELATLVNTHPVILMAGFQSGVRPFVAGVPGIALYPRYHSIALGIPLVRLANQPADHASETFFYLAQLSVDNFAAFGAAKTVFGIPMELVRVSNQPGTLRVSSKVWGRDLVAVETRADEAADPQVVKRHFKAMKKALSDRMVSPSRAGLKCSNLDWHLDQAQIDSVHAVARVLPEFAPGLPEQVSSSDETLGRGASGSFRMRAHWSHSTPETCF